MSPSENVGIIAVFSCISSFWRSSPLTGLAAWKQEPEGSWGEDGKTFHCMPELGETAFIGFGRKVLDEYPGGTQRYDGIVVGDLALEFRVVPGDEVQVVGAELREGDDAFEIRIPVGDDFRTLLT